MTSFFLRLTLLFSIFPLSAAAQQNAAAALIGHPLYLRGAWAEDKIHFDPTGQPVTEAHRGPLTLSGIDLTSVFPSGRSLLLRGRRVALIARSPGAPLERVSVIPSSTNMVFTFHRQYQADEPVEFLLAADAQGDFASGLQALFADGLPQLASSVPPFWRCYAQTWFVATPVPDTAQQDVLHCAESQLPAPPERPGYSPPSADESIAPTLTQAAAQLGLSGDSTVYASIDPTGRPAAFQVLSPIGAGLDEAVLQAISRSTFRPATQGETPVRGDLQFTIRLGAALPRLRH